MTELPTGGESPGEPLPLAPPCCPRTGEPRHRGRCCRADSRMQTQLNIRLSEAEKALLEERAAAAGLTVSDYVRRRALGDEAR